VVAQNATTSDLDQNVRDTKVHVAQEHAVAQYLHVRPGMMMLYFNRYLDEIRGTARKLGVPYLKCSWLEVQR